MYKLEAMAQDKGFPPLSRTVEVQIDVVDRANNPPVWDHIVYGPIYCKENMAVGAKVVSVKARSVTYYVVDSDRNEGKDYFEINRETGEIFTKVMFDREKQGAYALEVEARDGAPSARPNSNGQPNSGMSTPSFSNFSACFRSS
ncbi:neural-cadherin-like [Apis florea]|uniref:neural-cadherin-like n=1 Tax=Apis florea TaxID=7463 RepID=UPI0012FE9786|nr:neural-cadherin-like [Apis florea]